MDYAAIGQEALSHIAAAKDLVSVGRPLVLFPEGTRVPHGTEPKLQSGFAGLYKLLGLPPEVAADPESFTALIHPDDRERVLALYAAAFASPGTGGHYEAEFRIRRSDDHLNRWLLVTGRVAFDDAGKPIRAVGILRDTTDRREVEETLRKREEQLRVALETQQHEDEVALSRVVQRMAGALAGVVHQRLPQLHGRAVLKFVDHVV